MGQNTKDAQSKELNSTSLLGRCLGCNSWQGDKIKMLSLIEQNPQSMDRFKGWPEYGACGIEYEWAEIEIKGDASVSMEVPANFGCPYFNA